MPAPELQAPMIKPLNIDGLFKTPQIPETGEDYEDSDFELGMLGSLETRKCRFYEVRLGIQTAVEWNASNSVFRNTLLEIGRVGSLDLTGSTVNLTVFRSMKVGYGNLVNSVLNDVLFEDCHFDTLDLFSTKAKRVKFQDCTVNELDIRNLEAEHVDLRGLEIGSIRGVPFLRGSTIGEHQLMQISEDLAKGAGIFIS